MRYTYPVFPSPSARYYPSAPLRNRNSSLSIWLSVDPMVDKYPNLSPYTYCADNPVRLVDPDGMEWVDVDGNKIQDHTKIEVYIFYDPNSFESQSKAMAEAAVKKYGAGSVALSNVTTEQEFMEDWQNMSSQIIKEVNLNYHGNNQTLMLNSSEEEYITSTGNGVTNKSNASATNVQDLPAPKGNVNNAQLNINSCKSNNTGQYPLKGTKQTLMQAFYSTFTFKTVRGTSAGVSYNRLTKRPKPQWFWQSWDYMGQQPPQPSLNWGDAQYFKGGGHW